MNKTTILTAIVSIAIGVGAVLGYNALQPKIEVAQPAPQMPAPKTGGTLENIKAKGFVQCGINTGLPGFAFKTEKGDWAGFDVAFCNALAAAVLGDATKVKYTPLTGKTRFSALASGEIDVLSRNTTWTLSRDVDLGFTFIGVNYYDGQGFMGKASLGITSASELNGASVCIQTGTTTELNLADFFRSNNMTYEPVPIETNSEARKSYEAGRCDVYTTDASGLAATRSSFPNPADHIVFPEIISKEPLGPVVRHGDDAWADVVSWTLKAMINAEELGVTSGNVDKMLADTKNPEVERLLGTSTLDLGKMLKVNNNWAYNIIKQVGNYGEVFERYLGMNTPLQIGRGLNEQWSKGGLLYAPPMR